MVPRLLSPQFGFFDDAITILASRKIAQGTWNIDHRADAGRFTPVYFLSYALIYLLGGESPFWSFIAMTLIFFGITISLIYLVYNLTSSKQQAWMAGMLFALSGPIIESFYTLSKAEPLQTIWIILSLLLMGLYTRAQSRLKKIAAISVTSFALIMAIASKETSLVMIPISLLWFFGALVRRKFLSDEDGYKIRKAYLLATLTSGVIYIIVRMHYMPWGLTEKGYASRYVLNLERILATGRIWFDLLNRDYLYLAPLVAVFVFLCVRKKQVTQFALLFDTCVWMAGWTAVFLPWPWAVEYYLLPFAIGSSIFGAILFKKVFTTTSTSDKLSRLLAIICLVLTALLFLLTLPNIITNARLQLAVDASNSEMLNYLVENVPSNSIVIINIQEPNQYVDDIKLFLSDIFNRTDIHYDHFKFQAITTEMNSNPFYYITSPIFDNQFYPSVRLGVLAHTSNKWNQSLLDFLGDNAEVVYETKDSFRLLNVDSLRLICPFIRSIDYCAPLNTPFDRRILSYGWKIYQVPIQANTHP
jgi:branched-subunit amino acid transport protein